MNNTQKANIEIILNGAKQMKSLADNLGGCYHDEKIANFANAAISDYNETRAFILQKIDENIPLFLNLDDLRIDNGAFGWMWCEKDCIFTKIGNFFQLAYKFHPMTRFEPKRGNAGGLYCSRKVEADEIEIVNVSAQTSDTSLPEYSVCSAWSLTQHCEGRYDTNGKYDAKTWNEIYNLATWTRAQTKLLWKTFEDAVKIVHETQKQICNDRENLFKKNSEVGVYVKIERTI